MLVLFVLFLNQGWTTWTHNHQSPQLTLGLTLMKWGALHILWVATYLFFFLLRERERERIEAFASIRPLVAQKGSQWQTPPPKAAAFLLVPWSCPAAMWRYRGTHVGCLFTGKPQVLCLLSYEPRFPVGSVVNRGAVSSGPLLWAHSNVLLF